MMARALAVWHWFAPLRLVNLAEVSLLLALLTAMLYRHFREKYLLRSEAEWHGRQQAIHILDEVLSHLKQGDVQAIGNCTQRNFDGPIQTIIPWAGNLYTDTLTRRVRAEFGPDFWGFWMLGGMSGGGGGSAAS